MPTPDLSNKRILLGSAESDSMHHSASEAASSDTWDAGDSAGPQYDSRTDVRPEIIGANAVFDELFDRNARAALRRVVELAPLFPSRARKSKPAAGALRAASFDRRGGASDDCLFDMLISGETLET